MQSKKAATRIKNRDATLKKVKLLAVKEVTQPDTITLPDSIRMDLALLAELISESWHMKSSKLPLTDKFYFLILSLADI